MCVCFQSQVSATEEIIFSVIVQLKMGAHKRARMGMDFFVPCSKVRFESSPVGLLRAVLSGFTGGAA